MQAGRPITKYCIPHAGWRAGHTDMYTRWYIDDKVRWVFNKRVIFETPLDMEQYIRFPLSPNTLETKCVLMIHGALDKKDKHNAGG